MKKDQSKLVLSNMGIAVKRLQNRRGHQGG
jgi:hypothetical protein